MGCDDGNNIDGDGCSSDCRQEMWYRCRNVSVDSPSVCKYGKNITLFFMSI